MAARSNLSTHNMVLSIRYILSKYLLIMDSKSSICAVYSAAYLDIYMGNALTVIVALVLFCLSSFIGNPQGNPLK